MQCPGCGGARLKIEVVFRTSVGCQFTTGEEFDILEPLLLDSEWRDDSACQCMDCSWSGTVLKARDSGNG